MQSRLKELHDALVIMNSSFSFSLMLNSGEADARDQCSRLCLPEEQHWTCWRSLFTLFIFVVNPFRYPSS